MTGWEFSAYDYGDVPHPPCKEPGYRWVAVGCLGGSPRVMTSGATREEALRKARGMAGRVGRER